MNTRIKEVREKSGLTQEEFGRRIGSARNTIANYERGNRKPSNTVINSICREFGINKDWLLSGEGEQTVNRTKSQEIGDFASSVMHLPDESFKKRFVEALQNLNENDWKHLEEIANKLLKDKEG